MKDWFENESFWTQYAPIMFDAPRWAEAPAVAAGILKLAEISPSEIADIHILDAGCGIGRITIELAMLGAKVTGVDLIKPFLDAAEESAQYEKVDICLIQKDLRTFNSSPVYDVAVNMYTSFGYCKTIEEDVQILKNIARALKHGGIFVIEMLGKELAARDFIEGEWFERAGYTVLTEFSVEGAWEGLKSRWVLYDKDGLKADHTFIQRLYSAAELKQLLILAGFHSIEIYGDFDKSRYNEKARTMIVLARV